MNRIRDLSQASESTHIVQWGRVFRLSLFSRNFDDQLSSNFHNFVILCKLCLDYQRCPVPLNKNCFRAVNCVLYKRRIFTLRHLNKAPFVIHLYAHYRCHWILKKGYFPKQFPCYIVDKQPRWLVWTAERYQNIQLCKQMLWTNSTFSAN